VRSNEHPPGCNIVRRNRIHPVEGGGLARAAPGEDPLLHQIPLSEASEDQIAARLLARSNEALPLDEPARAAHHYLRLTAVEVRATFAKWFDRQL
jgi:hypothetical protein